MKMSNTEFWQKIDANQIELLGNDRVNINGLVYSIKCENNFVNLELI